MKIKELEFFAKKVIQFPRALGFYHNLLEEENLSREIRAALILKRLKRIVQVAYENTIFYRTLYNRAGFELGDFKTLMDFERLPVVSKEDLRNNGNAFVAQNAKINKMKLSTTGGSTGEPVKVYHNSQIPLEALGWWVLKKWGIHPGENVGFLYRYKPQNTKVSNLIWYPTRRSFLDASCISDQECQNFYQECRKNQVVYLCGYVGAIQEFANFLDRKSLKLPSLRVVWTTAAPLPEGTRILLRQIFDCPVFSQYGCCEIFWLASECPALKGLHIFDTLRHLEVVDNRMRSLEAGVYGEVLLTDLLNESFPLIRYRNGDRAMKLARCCDCGSKFPLLAPVKGRMTEMIRFKDGSCVAGDYLTTIFDGDPEAVRSFQIVQSKDYTLCIRYVPLARDATRRVEVVANELRNRFATHKPVITIERVREIPSDRGKTRFIISEIS